MFKKLLTNLPFNPSLLGQVGFYTVRLRKESFVRGAGIITIILALFIQTFAVISPPQASLANSPNDIIYGGFTTREQTIWYCLDQNKDIHLILEYYKITCDILANAETIPLSSTAYNKQLHSLGRVPQPATNPKNGKPSNQYTVTIPGVEPLYMKNLWYWDTYASSTYKVLKMTNTDGVLMFMMYDCGNIITVGEYPPPVITKPNPNTKPSATFRANCTNIAWSSVDPNGAPRVRLYIAKKTNSSEVDWNNKGPFVYSASPPSTGTQNNGTWNIPSKYRDTTSSYRVFAVISDKLPTGVMDDTNFVLATPTEGVIFGPCLTEQPPTTIPEQATPTDECPKIAGIQTSKNQCDVCPNIPGEQSSQSQCYPCPVAQTNTSATACMTFDKQASNQTRGIANANNTTANAGDVVIYTLTATNKGKVEFKDFVFDENLADVLEYSDMNDFGGGALTSNQHLIWPKRSIPANSLIKVQFNVKVKSPVPSTPRSASDPGSFDLCMTNVFYGKSVNICVKPPVSKQIETVATTLPNTGPGTSLLIGFITITLMGYFFARNKTMVDELDIVRKEFTSGGPS